jgi:hypothetical protein
MRRQVHRDSFGEVVEENATIGPAVVGSDDTVVDGGGGRHCELVRTCNTLMRDAYLRANALLQSLHWKGRTS